MDQFKPEEYKLSLKTPKLPKLPSSPKRFNPKPYNRQMKQIRKGF